MRPGSKTIPDQDQRPGQLFHLLDDPQEKKSLSGEHPDIVARLKAELLRIQKSDHTRPQYQ
jgi:hypothetical protein